MITDTMFQIEKRVTAITLNDSEREVINERISEFQQKTGVVYSSIKELFSALLTTTLSGANTQNNDLDIEKANEIESTNIEIIGQLSKEIQTLSDENNNLLNSNNALTLEIEEIKNNPSTVEVEKTIEVEKKLQSNQILITLTDSTIGSVEKKQILLDEISKRRAKRFKLEQPESLPELCEKMIFNTGTVFNIAGEFYTGF